MFDNFFLLFISHSDVFWSIWFNSISFYVHYWLLLLLLTISMWENTPKSLLFLLFYSWIISGSTELASAGLDSNLWVGSVLLYMSLTLLGSVGQTGHVLSITKEETQNICEVGNVEWPKYILLKSLSETQNTSPIAQSIFHISACFLSANISLAKSHMVEPHT